MCIWLKMNLVYIVYDPLSSLWLPWCVDCIVAAGVMTSPPFRDSKVIFICPLWTFLCKCWCVSGLHVYCQCVMQSGTPTGPGLTRPRRSALGCGLVSVYVVWNVVADHLEGVGLSEPKLKAINLYVVQIFQSEAKRYKDQLTERRCHSATRLKC